MKKKKWSKKKKIIFIIIAILIVIIAVLKIASPKEVEEEKIEFEAVEKRDIAQSISATGVISTSDTKNVTGKLTGTEIKKVNVKEGDKVAVGDVICTFDTSELKQSLATAQTSKNLAVAQGNIGTQIAQRNVDDLVKQRDKNLGDIQKTVDGARANLKSAESVLEESKTKLNTLNTQLEKLNNDKKNIQNQLNAITTQTPSEPTTPSTPDASQGVTDGNIQIDLTNQLKEIDIKINGMTSQIQSATAEVTTKQNEVNNRKREYDSAQDAYNTSRDNFNSQIATLQDQVTTSQLSTSMSDNSSQSQVRTIQNQIEDGVIKSTVNGTVTSVNVKAGDIYTGSTIAVIEGCEDFIVEAEIDEYDIPDVKVGMRVLIKTDATREEELEGKIVYVASSATNSQSSSLTQMATATPGNSAATYTVKIELQTPNDRLRLGMNAKLSIITDSREKVWSVPYEAVYDREDGTSYIEILKNEETKEKQELNVKRGLEGTYYVEIESDELKDGMNVVLPKVEAGDSLENLLQAMGADAGI